MMERLEKALEADQLYEYLLGKEGYYFHPALANLPTDPLAAFHFVEQHYQRDAAILEQCKMAIGRMSADPEFSWFSLYYLYALLNFLRVRNIRMELSTLVRQIEGNLLSHKEQLIANTSYEGSEWKNGLWGDVMRMVTMIGKEQGIEFLRLNAR